MAVKSRYKDLRPGDLVQSPDEGFRIIHWAHLWLNSPDMTFGFVGDEEVHRLNRDNLCRLEKRFEWGPKVFVVSEN